MRKETYEPQQKKFFSDCSFCRYSRSVVRKNILKEHSVVR